MKWSEYVKNDLSTFNFLEAEKYLSKINQMNNEIGEIIFNKEAKSLL